jgi:DNA-binding NarL/FixJ family response regulator
MYNEVEIFEAEDGVSAVALLQENTYDLITMDVQMPNTDSFALMQYVKKEYPTARVLMFSMSPESIYAIRFIKAGAKGFISKSAPLEEMKMAIDKVLNDKKYFSEEILMELTEGDAGANKNVFDLLSPREFEIVQLLLKGKTISHIAAELTLSLSTVGTHKARIFQKLKVINLLELKALANSYI